MPGRAEIKRRAAWAFGMVTGLTVANACSTDVAVGFDETGGTGGQVGRGGASASGGAAPGTGGSAGTGCSVAECQGKTYACGNCDDDDRDGLIDALDPDCLGSCDNTEDSFYGGIPGQSGGGCRQDCYFDQDSGSGNDGCDWTHSCDPLSVAPGYPPNGDPQCAYDPNAMLQGRVCAALQATQSTECLNYCQPLTPKGCDCFGCCELPARSGKFVWLGSNQGGLGTCTRDKLGDPSACQPCTQVAACARPCGPCDICAGETSQAPSCGEPPVCESGTLPCGPGATCADQYYCISGCCAPVPR
jgi:hypothetical protein